MRQQIGELTRSSAGHQRISISDLKRFVLPLPPHTAQVEIAEEASRILSVLSVLMTDVSNSLSRAAVLRQAILKKAFEGKLVPQDPDDEPASILLERIRAACAQTPARRAPRKREVHA
jgi:type I restriction enzyme S subunit